MPNVPHCQRRFSFAREAQTGLQTVRPSAHDSARFSNPVEPGLYCRKLKEEKWLNPWEKSCEGLDLTMFFHAAIPAAWERVDHLPPAMDYSIPHSGPDG
jgi:hypothetical protein